MHLGWGGAGTTEFKITKNNQFNKLCYETIFRIVMEWIKNKLAPESQKLGLGLLHMQKKGMQVLLYRCS